MSDWLTQMGALLDRNSSSPTNRNRAAGTGEENWLPVMVLVVGVALVAVAALRINQPWSIPSLGNEWQNNSETEYEG